MTPKETTIQGLVSYLETFNEDQLDVIYEYITGMYHQSEDAYDNDYYVDHDSSFTS